jgi:geranylgeranyl diphosphate synthase, type II
MEIIKNYQQKVNNIITSDLIIKIENNQLKKILIHSLSGGKRLRSIISLDILENLQKKNKKKLDINKELCIIVELFHNSCLIIDDLPVMDNDEYRRGKKTVWYEYGILNAHLITNYMLYQCIININNIVKKLINKNIYNREKIYDIKHRILNNYFKNMNDAAYGQFLDIYPLLNVNYNFPLNIKENLLRKIITAKTAPFFEVAFLLPYLFFDNNPNEIKIFREISLLFGLLYQISDDFEDQEQDLKKDGCIIQNYVVVVGRVKARKHFYIFLKVFIEKICVLDLYSPLIEAIINYLSNKVDKYK